MDFFFFQAEDGIRDLTVTGVQTCALLFASIGRLVSADTVNKVMTTHWVSELPTDQVSFNIGKFEEFDIRDPRIPPVTVHINTEAHHAIAQLLPHMSQPEEQVGADVANSLAFFTKA